MIDTQELSLGNYLKKIKDIVKVTSFSHSLISVTIVGTSNQILCLPLELEPISLTEEILLNCGFDENMVLSTIEGEIRYYGDGNINIGGEDSCTLGMVYIAKCKYLHQLQNLYFALTGEELEVKL